MYLLIKPFLPILYAAMRFGRFSAFVVSVAAILSLSYFFMHPIHSFAVHDTRYLISFVIMIAIGQLVAWLSQQAALAKSLRLLNGYRRH